MRYSQRRFWLAITSLVSIWPTLAAGQTVTKNDAIGAWVATVPSSRDEDSVTSFLEYFLLLRSDGSWKTSQRHNGAWGQWVPTDGRLGDTIGTWTLAGDTLWFDNPGQIRTTRGNDWQLNTPYRVAVQRGQLVLIPQGFEYKESLKEWALAGDDTCGTRVFTRFDTLKAPPAPQPKSRAMPITINRTALIGTWVRVDTSSRGSDGMLIHTDTIELRADSTLRHASRYNDRRVSSDSQTGTWGLYPGDVLRVQYPEKQPNGQTGFAGYTTKIMLQDQQLVLGSGRCNGHPWVYKRTSP